MAPRCFKICLQYCSETTLSHLWTFSPDVTISVNLELTGMYTFTLNWYLPYSFLPTSSPSDRSHSAVGLNGDQMREWSSCATQGSHLTALPCSSLVAVMCMPSRLSQHLAWWQTLVCFYPTDRGWVWVYIICIKKESRPRAILVETQ